VGLSQNSSLLRHSTVTAGDLEFFLAFMPEHGTVVTTAKTTACSTTGGFHVLLLLRRVGRWNVVFALKFEF